MTMTAKRCIRICAICLGAAMLLSVAGCPGPSRANIELRRQNQELRSRIEELRRTRDADLARIQSLERERTTVPTLPQEQLDRLFTAHGLRFGRLTGGADLNPEQPGDEGLRIQVVPIDGMGQPLKAAGTFEVDAFDLERTHSPLIGRWSFSIEEARESWFGTGLLYTYVLICPWQDVVPQRPELTVRVTFTDELTGRVFTEQRTVQIRLPVRAAEPTAGEFRP
jgi:hypothetical protein